MNADKNFVPAPPLLQKVPEQTMLSVWERLVKDVSIPLDRLQQAKLMMDEARREEARAVYAVRLAQAQHEMAPISRDMDNPQTKSKYASLAQVDRAIKPIYTKYDIAISFDSRPSDKGENWVRIIAIINCGEHCEERSIDMLADGMGAKGAAVMTRTHAMGSALTYGRRQLLKMIFNLSEADDDGNAAAADESDITNEQILELTQLLELTGRSEQLFCQKFRIETIGRLPASKYEEAERFLKQYVPRVAGDATTKP